MRFAVLFIVALCLIQYGHTYCVRPATACGVVETGCMGACSMGGCGGGSCGGSCNGCANKCGCGGPCGCYRDPCNICAVCKETTSPVCSCLSDCGCKSKIYFPEVEYPATIIEMAPNYYGTCWSY